ncbi:FUSC family protein [Aestuariibaculum suncheonense]|uniref:FUSC family protein n=1 Tax=Aestuariibaculum suncheonense TaxID=1028745 RepID=A0A8J6QDP3_9FLAO|nr:FUSC family protein [Aestuariibaculum suncheonense]MBD0835160.1 FUSC family protein [Aestuariibaculum suncheonense]
MKKTLTILAVIASIFAVIFSVLPISNLAIFPGIAALLFAGGAFYLSKKAGEVKKLVQFSFLLTIIALALTSYKAIFTTTEVENTDELQAKEEEFQDAAIEELEGLEIEIDDAELGDLEIDNTELEGVEIDDSQIESIEINDAELENIELKADEIIDSEIESSDLENLEIE